MYSELDTFYRHLLIQTVRKTRSLANRLNLTGVKGGSPHSDIHGSKLIRSSPRLFAAYHVLLRLCMPRHPPNALTTLNRSHCQCSSIDKTITNRHQPTDPKTHCLLPKSYHLTNPATFYNQTIQMPSTCSIRSLYWSYAEQLTCARSLRPASRD